MYSYKLFNKDSLNTLQPVGDTAKTKLLNALALFSFFEKNINGLDSISVGSPVHGYMKNVQLEFSDNNGNTAGRGESTLSFPSGSGCSYTMVVTETYTYLEIYVNGDLASVYQNYSVQMAVTVICTGDETQAPGGGGGGGWNWYNYATGGYFNSSSPVNGQYWWTSILGGGGGGGGGIIYSPQVQYLTSKLSSLNQTQTDWLQNNEAYAQKLYNLISSAEEIDEMVLSSAMINLEVARLGLIDNWNEALFKIILDTYLPVELRLYKDVILPYIKLQYAIEAQNDPALKETMLGKAELLYRATKELLHLGLDVVGLAPVVGEIFDLANGGLYVLEGDFFNASLSLASMVPFIGTVPAGARIIKEGLKIISIKKANGLWHFPRKDLRKLLGLVPGDGKIGHHVIPLGKESHPLIQRAAEAGFDMNSIGNAKGLDAAVAHTGRHQTYSDNILVKMEDVWRTSGSNMHPQQAKMALENLITHIKNIIDANPGVNINLLSF